MQFSSGENALFVGTERLMDVDVHRPEPTRSLSTTIGIERLSKVEECPTPER